MNRTDLSLYLVTDERVFGGRSLCEVVRAAVAGGVTCVQLREKRASRDQIREKASTLRALLAPFAIALIINDYVEIAREVGAHGVHLGKRDCDVKEARRILGPDAWIGLSVESPRDLAQSDLACCDYISASPVFATPTKDDAAKPLGLDGLARLRERCQLPLIAIGGITVENAPAIARAGTDGIAVVSSVLWSSRPQKAARSLRQSFERGRHEG